MPKIKVNRAREQRIARQLDRPIESRAGLGQHRFCKTIGRYMGQDQATHSCLRRDAGCVPGR